LTENNEVIPLESAQQKMRQHFLGWQCRLRQHAMRNLGGRPSPGMRPDVILEEAGVVYEAVTVLLVRRGPQESTAEFRHMVKRTNDPKERYAAALKHFSANYYQHPDEFSDRMTALFAPDSAAGARILAAGRCRLDFSEKQQLYRLPCEVRPVPDNDPFRDATYWHNSLFNPALGKEVTILSFEPDWRTAEADPPSY
jgi:hypothetical protein